MLFSFFLLGVVIGLSSITFREESLFAFLFGVSPLFGLWNDSLVVLSSHADVLAFIFALQCKNSSLLQNWQ
jgi:hypothetical protein